MSLALNGRCKQCNEPIAVVYALDVYQFPYNPEWPLQREDAGRFCSATCLARYLGGVS